MVGWLAAADKVVIVVVTPEFLVVVIDPVVVVVVLPISPVAPESKIKLSLNQGHENREPWASQNSIFLGSMMPQYIALYMRMEVTCVEQCRKVE